MPDTTASADPAPREEFVRQIRDVWPGGKHIADHVDDGAWKVLPTVLQDQSAFPNLHWIVESIVKAYPPLRVPYSDGTEVIDAAVFVVPEFVHHLLEWYSDGESEFYALEPTHDAVFPREPPHDADLLCELPALLGVTLPDEAIDQAAQHGTLANLLAYLDTFNALALDEEAYADRILAYTSTLITES